VVEGDVCVVGSGPAGATLIRELTGSGLRVILLESGGATLQPAADALSEIESVGSPRFPDQALFRPRILGGASHFWTGRCAPFDGIDYQDRPWVPHSGWPFGPDEIGPYLDRSAAHLGLGVGSGYTGGGFWHIARRRASRQGPDDGSLLPFFWQFSQDGQNRFDSMRFGRRMMLHQPANVRVFTNTTVLHINTNPSASVVESVEVGHLEGGRWTIRAPVIVLCAGGIENARLLLASNRVATAGLGNGRDLVGRFLMDHPRGSVASFDPRDYRELRRHLGLHNVRSAEGSHLFCQGLRLSPAVQRSEELLNCTAWLTEMVTHDDPWSALQRVLRGKAALRKDGKAIMANLGLFTEGLHRHIVLRQGLPRKIEGLKLSCTVEQRPDRDSRVSLAEKVDGFGMPLSRIDWRVSPQEQQTVRRMAELAAAHLGRFTTRPPVLEEWVQDGAAFPPSFHDVAHPTGTTRMADHPANGVVDAECQVHGVRGLYVAGSSVFPTGSHANPTQMIVALAVRLADTLKGRTSAHRNDSATLGRIKSLDRPHLAVSREAVLPL